MKKSVFCGRKLWKIPQTSPGNHHYIVISFNIWTHVSMLRVSNGLKIAVLLVTHHRFWKRATPDLWIFLNCIATSLFTYEEIPYCYKCDLNDVSLIIYSSVVRDALDASTDTVLVASYSFVAANCLANSIASFTFAVSFPEAWAWTSLPPPFPPITALHEFTHSFAFNGPPFGVLHKINTLPASSSLLNKKVGYQWGSNSRSLPEKHDWCLFSTLIINLDNIIQNFIVWASIQK